MKKRVRAEIGKIYGRWTVIGEAKSKGHQRRWKTKCECGNESSVQYWNLWKGHSTQCKKCASINLSNQKSIDETGKIYGQLTVVKKAGIDKFRNVQWHVRCECGNEEIRIGRAFRQRGATKCRHCMISKKPGESHLNNWLRSYQNHAKQRKLEWGLTKEEFTTLTSGYCTYCGTGPRDTYRRTSINGTIKLNGVDRIDSTRGYTRENVVPCCTTCNIAKSKMSKKDFLAWIERVYNHTHPEQPLFRIIGKDTNPSGIYL